MEKLHQYQGITGRFHQLRDNIKEFYHGFESEESNILQRAKESALGQLKGNTSANKDYSHIFRCKSRAELIRVSAAVMGIEFSYAAETAFVSPTLLKIGVEHQHMTLVWALSPLVGFFLCPILGSFSDRCKLNMGRRRPFILLLSIGVVLGNENTIKSTNVDKEPSFEYCHFFSLGWLLSTLGDGQQAKIHLTYFFLFQGLLLVPNGENLGYWFGDEYHSPPNVIPVSNATQNGTETMHGSSKNSHPWGIFFTVLGTVLLDFDADACQSPSRAYLLDVCVPEDHAKGLSTFTIMAGLGGFFGYSMGGLNWDETEIGRRLGGHVKAVFSIITFIFVACVTLTITSFSEIPLWAISSNENRDYLKEKEQSEVPLSTYGALDNEVSILNDEHKKQLTTESTEEQISIVQNVDETSFMETPDPLPEKTEVENVQPIQSSVQIESLSHYLLSIVYMPHSLRMVCLTNLFCWMAHVCYSLYFTDFVGEAIFNGDPKATEGSEPQIRYEEGIRFGCWGMAMYSLSCACYSLVIDKLIQRFRAKNVYVGGLCFYCTGMALMALTRAKSSVILFSWTAGVMYSTLFTMPYLLVAHYHYLSTFELDENGQAKHGSGVRGLGTDIAIISSMVFLAQFILSICMGTIIKISGTTTAVIYTASFLSLCGALSATKIMYLDL